MAEAATTTAIARVLDFVTLLMLAAAVGCWRPTLPALTAFAAGARTTATVYPARTVTGFSSMFTGAPPKTHGMRSNFVPSLGVKCESIFDSAGLWTVVGAAVGHLAPCERLWRRRGYGDRRYAQRRN